ncbi:MAG: RDD family protein [Pyrinomonadaceae bacterium]
MDEQNSNFGFAAFWKRAVAFVVDLAVVVALYSLLISALNSLLALPVEYSPILERGLSLKMSPYVEEHFIEIALLYSFSKLAILFPYFTLLESSRWQATLGKLILGIKVTDLSGGRISFARATGRFFGKILSGQVLLIGYLMAAFTERKQALHDLLAGTLVVRNGSVVSMTESPTNHWT